MKPSIQTYTGLDFNVENPKSEMVCLEDIAHALSMTARFNGHLKIHYSVAAHCVLVAFMVYKMGGSESEVLEALLHDAEEAYLGDIPTPIKRALMPNYEVYAQKIKGAIWDHFGLYWSDQRKMSEIVHKADCHALWLETVLFKNGRPEWATQFRQEGFPDIHYITKANLIVPEGIRATPFTPGAYCFDDSYSPKSNFKIAAERLLDYVRCDA